MQETLRIGKVIITNPPSYVFFQLLLSLGISPTVAATCQFFQPWLHFGFGLWMHRELAFAFHHIKGVAEIFHSAHIRHYGLFLVDLWLILLYTFLLLLLNYFTTNLFHYWLTLLYRKGITEMLYIDVSVCKITVCSTLEKVEPQTIIRPLKVYF